MLALCSTLAGAASAAPLPDTPETLLEQLRLQREARDRFWDPVARRLELLSLSSNATALAGGAGQVQWLKLDSSQSLTALLFHEMNARAGAVPPCLHFRGGYVRLQGQALPGLRGPALGRR